MKVLLKDATTAADAASILLAPLDSFVLRTLSGEDWAGPGRVAEMHPRLVRKAAIVAVGKGDRRPDTRRRLEVDLLVMAEFLAPYEVGSTIRLHLGRGGSVLEAS